MNFIGKLYLRTKIIFYKNLSGNKKIQGKYKAKQPILLEGKGQIIFGDKITLGFYPSPYLYSSYIHIEARSIDGSIHFGSGSKVNNACVFISDTASISIGKDCLIGSGVQIYDTDFHTLYPQQRHIAPESKPVEIGNNVFIGSNATILKGVKLGDNSIVAANAVVSQSAPANSILAGNPAKLVKTLEEK